MKPANFPERVRQRRLGALRRLPHGVVEERAILIERTSTGSQRGVRTKKDRTDRAKFAR